MADYTLRLRCYSPETGEAPYWEDFQVDLDGHRSVLDGILQAKDRTDASIGIRSDFECPHSGQGEGRLARHAGNWLHLRTETVAKCSGSLPPHPPALLSAHTEKAARRSA